MPAKAAVPSAQVNKESTTIYEAGTPIGKELEAPAAPTPMQTIPSPPAIDPLVQEALDKSKGQELLVDYRTPSGDIKSFYTRNLQGANIPGEFLGAKVVTPSGGASKPYTYTKDNQQVIFDVREQVLATPTLNEQSLMHKTSPVSPIFTTFNDILNNPEQKLIYETSKNAPSPLTTKGANQWAIQQLVQQGKLPEGYGGYYTPITPEQEIKQDYSTMSDPVAIVRNALATFLSAPVRVMGGVYTDISNLVTGKPSTGATANAYSSGINPNQPNRPSKQVAEWEYGIKQETDPFKKWVNVQKPAYENVILPIIVPYGIGGALGGFAATRIGSTVAFYIGSKAITPSLALNTGVGTIFGAGMVKSGVEAYKGGTIKEWGAMNILSLPMFVIPFKAGYNAGGGYVQRTGAMSTVTEPTQRTQQKAIYDMMGTTENLHEPYLEQKPYNILNVKEPSPPYATEQFLKSPVSQLIRKPAIGGSTAMDIQMGEFYRKGGYPERVLEIARERQSQTIQPEMRNVPLKLSGTPGDIDILLGGKFATTKMAEKWGGKLDTHVHVSKPGTEYWGGYSTKPFTDSYVSFMNEPIKVKTLSVREQFLRYGHSVLPSNIAEKSYRAYKDVPGFYDTFDVLQFQKGGTKLNTAMDRFLNPSGYKSPKVTIGEKFVKVIGGATKINEDWSYGNSKAGYVSSYGVSPIISNPIYRNEGYKDNIKQLTYYESGYKIPTTYTPIRTDYKGYTPPEPTYTPIKTDYNKYVPPVPTYNPPPYNPDYKPPTYIPDYKPTDYTPPYKPPVPYYNPPPYYPGYNPPKNPPKKKKLEEDPLEIMTRLFKGFNVLIKRQHIFGGVKTGYQGYEIKNRVPMTKESAYSTLATMLKNTARASGKIVEVETRNRPIFNKSEFKWVDVADQFYKKQGIIIQKAAHRIGTPGELKEITYKGLAARRRR